MWLGEPVGGKNVAKITGCFFSVAAGLGQRNAGQ
jgi:hypothetical protein